MTISFEAAAHEPKIERAYDNDDQYVD